VEHLSRLERIGERVLRLHGLIYEKTNGLVGHRIPGISPSLMLHTLGAKTGQVRTSTLSYARDHHDYLIVASMGGAPRSPGWYHNLKKQPDVEINVGQDRFHVRARSVLPDDSDYPRLWQVVNDNNADRYRAYQTRTERPIPIVVLTP
jgi:F420H(2)-dependent quinone reductase